jgi:hypothetical protein
MVMSRVLNLAALGFTVFMSAVLLLYVNWGALQSECLRRDTCDIMEVRRAPLPWLLRVHFEGQAKAIAFFWDTCGNMGV